jgi:hypothetical protein
MITQQDQTIAPTAPTAGASPTDTPEASGPTKEAKGGAVNRSVATKPVSGGKAGRRSAAKPAAKGGSKQDRVLAMLRQKEGVSVATIMKATGWQKHSVHGFLAGVVRKKLGLNLQVDLADGKRTYRVATGKPSKAGAAARKRGR